MALFRGASSGPGKAEALRRVRQKQWKDREGMSRALTDLAAFRDLKPEELIPLLESGEPTVRSFAEVQIRDRLDPRGIDAMVRGLKGKTTRSQSLILHTMLRAKPDLAVKSVEALVTEGDRALSRLAMEALSALPSHLIGSEFTRFLSHDKAEIRRMALMKVLDSPALKADPAVRRVFVTLADDEDERIRTAILDALVELEPSEAVRLALQRIKDPSIAIQQKAVQVLSDALTRIGRSSEAEDQLLDLLTDGSEAVRNGVLDIIMKRPDRERLVRKLLLFCKGLMGWMRDRTLVSLRRYAKQLTASVLKLMDDPDEDVRSMALLLGSTLEAKEAVPHIIRLLEDEDWWVRMIAAETLGKIRDERAVQPLIKAMADVDSAMACIEALSRIGHVDGLIPICQALSRPQVEIRVEALQALGRMRDRRVAPVIEACISQDPSRAVRTRAEAALEAITGQRFDGAVSSHFAVPAELRARDIEGLAPLERLLVRTREMQASDLHVIVDAPPVVRVHGNLHELEDIPKYTPEVSQEQLFGLVPDRLKERMERDRQIDFCHMIPEIGRYRCNVYRERKGWAGAFRTIPNEVPTLDDVGLPSHLADLVI